MPLTVRLEDDVVKALQRYATPLVDDANDVIRRIIRLVEGSSGIEPGPAESGVDVVAFSSRSRKRERTSHALLRVDILKPGEELVLTPKRAHGRLPMPPEDPKLHCKVGPLPRARRNVIWAFDGKSYSLSALTEKLRDEHGLPLSGGALNGYDAWSLASDPSRTLWELAEERGRN